MIRFDFDPFAVDIDARLLLRAGRPVHLSPKAFDLLAHLIAQRPRAIPRQELYDLLWPKTFVVDTNLPLLISEIRQALGDGEHVVIRTVHRHGYAFAADARETSKRSVRAEGRDEAPHLLVYGRIEFPLLPGENVVGRDVNASVRIASTVLSRRHAAITIDAAGATVRDLNSKNGTRVDGRPVDAPMQLHDGAVVSFGTIEVIYRRLAPDAATVTAG
jgi:DNA-binding winged helix-turn-helix (wHTH) protein